MKRMSIWWIPVNEGGWWFKRRSREQIEERCMVWFTRGFGAPAKNDLATTSKRFADGDGEGCRFVALKKKKRRSDEVVDGRLCVGW